MASNQYDQNLDFNGVSKSMSDQMSSTGSVIDHTRRSGQLPSIDEEPNVDAFQHISDNGALTSVSKAATETSFSGSTTSLHSSLPAPSGTEQEETISQPTIQTVANEHDHLFLSATAYHAYLHKVLTSFLETRRGLQNIMRRLIEMSQDECSDSDRQTIVGLQEEVHLKQIEMLKALEDAVTGMGGMMNANRGEGNQASD